MNRTISLLAILLGAQLLLALFTRLGGPDLAAQAPDTPLVVFDRAAVDTLILSGPDGAEVRLDRADGAWRLPGLDAFPADGPRAEGLLARLADLRRGLPVATSEGARARFRVDDEGFERRIRLERDGAALATLYLGTSPGRGRSHARLEGEDAVLDLDLAAYELPVSASDWTDQTLLQIPQGDIAALEVAGLKLTRPPAGEGKDADPSLWRAEGLAEGEVLKPEAVEVLARRLAELRIGEPLGRDVRPDDQGLDRPALSLALVRHDGTRVDYLLARPEEKGDFMLQVSGRDRLFRLPAYTGEGLADAADRAALAASDKSAEAGGTR